MDDIVFCRFILRRRNNSFTVLRYLSDSAQYRRKLQAAFNIARKLQTLLTAVEKMEEIGKFLYLAEKQGGINSIFFEHVEGIIIWN